LVKFWNQEDGAVLFFDPALWWLPILGVPLLAFLIALEIRARKNGQTADRRGADKRGG